MAERSVRRARPRRRWAVLGVVVVLAALLAGVALHSPSGGGSKGPDVARAAVGGATAAPAPDGAAQALDAGVRDATLMARLFPLGAAAARAVLDEVATDAYRPALAAAIDAELVPLQRQVAGLAGRPIYRESVLAAKLASYAPPRAQVRAWVLLVAGQAEVPDNAAGTFATVTVDLVFERGAWRLDRTVEAPGPSPQVRDAPFSVDALTARLDGFADWRPGQ